ncbi:MAG: 3-hydroxy-3-methylglutaryl-CoA reductase [Chloroflexi bacterium]|nr:3-hydroxy-3-methylglutaryl-CoA reductase [Chloroflexota bacterium]
MSADPDVRSEAGDRLGARVRRRTWPRKNTPEQIAERQDLLRELPHWDKTNDLIFDWPRPPLELAGAVEALTAHVVLPVSVVGPLRLTLGTYHVDETNGRLVEEGRHTDEVYIPLAHSEGGLSASMQRGIAAVLDGASLQTFVLNDRLTRDSCLLFGTTEEAVICARWLADHTDELRAWLHDPANPLYGEIVAGVPRLSRRARLWEVDTHVLGPACHVLYRYTTGEACGPNMITRNSFALNHEFVVPRLQAATGIAPSRILLEANMGGDKKPSAQYFLSGGHGKTVLAGVSVREQTLRRVLRTTSRDMQALEHLGVHGSHASGMQSVAFTPASCVAAMFAATGQDLGMVGTSSMAHDVLDAIDDGIHLAIRMPGIEVGTVGGGTGLPHARAFLSMLGCQGPGSAYRLAQIVAAAALCLELSASAAASTPGSANFALAHLQQSGRS